MRQLDLLPCRSGGGGGGGGGRGAVLPQMPRYRQTIDELSH